MAYNQAPLKNIGDIRENIAKRRANKKLGIENQPSAFVEVVKEKGFKESISNPRTTKKEIQQTKKDRLETIEAAKTKDANQTFVKMEQFKPEKTDENPRPVLQWYKTTRSSADVGGGSEDIISRELDLDYSRKMYNVRAKALDRKSAYWAMREDIRKSRPDYKGSDLTKRQKSRWKDKAGGTGGKKNAIKNRYGFGFVPVASDSSATPGGGVEGSGNVSSSTSRSQGGVCTQAKALAGKCN